MVTSTMAYPLKNIPQPHPHDVLCGRGGGTNNHMGNSHWRMLVAANKELYVALPKKQKMLLSKSIVNAVRCQNPPGRFLQKDAGTERWYDVGDQRAQEKTSQALREGAPVIRATVTNTGTGTGTGSPDASVSTESLASTAKSNPNPPYPPTSSSLDGNGNAGNPQMNMPMQNGNAVPIHMQTQYAQQHAEQQQYQQQQQQQQGYTMRYPGAGMPLPPQYPTNGATYQHHAPGPGAYPHVAPSLPPPIPAQGPVPNRKPKKSLPPPQPVTATATITPSSSSPPMRTDTDNRFESEGRDMQPLPFSNAAPTNMVPNLYATSTSSAAGTSVANNVTDSDGANVRYYIGNPNVNSNADAYYEETNDDYVEPPAALDPTSGVSFGSLDMTDYDEAKLRSAGQSFGSVMSYAYNGIGNNNKQPEQGDARNAAATTAAAYAPAPVHAVDQNVQATMPAAIAAIAATQPATGNGMHVNFADADFDYAAVAVPPVDGGLEPAGYSFGSVMSISTQDKLEIAGMSFGSTMSVSVKGGDVDAVDGGLEAIGTSLGSLSLATEDQRTLVQVLEADQESVEAMPTFLNAAKSKGNLLECSDTDSDGEDESAQQRSAQKSAEWEMLQATFQAQTNAMPQSASMPPPLFPGGSPSTLNIPDTTFQRDFSQMSAMSVGDEDFDFRENILPDKKPGAYDGGFSSVMPPPTGVYEYEYKGGGGGEDDMPPPPPPMQKQESDVVDWRLLETTYLNRGDSLAEEF